MRSAVVKAAAVALPAVAVAAVGVNLSNTHRTAIVILAFPLILAVGIFTIPFVSSYADHAVVEQAASQVARWFWGHVISGAAFGVSVIAAHLLSGLLAESKMERHAGNEVALISGGAVMLALGLGADGVGPAAVILGGGQARMFFDGSGFMVTGLFITGVILFGSGIISQAAGMVNAGLINRKTGIIVSVMALCFMAVSAIPSTLGLYFLAVITVVIFFIIAIAVFRYRGA